MRWSAAWALVIEADGRAWHTRVEDFERDRRRDAEAAAAGYLTLRFTHHQLTHEQAVGAPRRARDRRSTPPARLGGCVTLGAAVPRHGVPAPRTSGRVRSGQPYPATGCGAPNLRPRDVEGSRTGHGVADAPNLRRRWGQLKRRMWMLRTRPMPMNAVSVLEPP